MKKNRIRKKWIILFLVVLVLIGLCFGFYGMGLKKVGKSSDPVTFVVESGTSKKEIAISLKNAGLIRSQYAVMLYLFFNSDLNLQAGTYELNRNMNANEIIEKIHKGDVKINTVSITLVEGKNMTDFKKLLMDNFFYTESDIESVLNNKEFIKKLIEKYDFLTETVLNGNIYYALEGYLFPDTYVFLENTSIEDIIIKMLDNTKVKLETIDLSNSSYSIHEILTMASIVELEAVKQEDREKVSQVIYKRLELGKGLGSDVTTYYAVKKNMGETLYMNDLKTINPYNTSEMNTSMAGKLPIGPICNPSLSSIQAVLNPSDTQYVYFVANTCTGEMFFTNTGTEHYEKVNELKSVCATN